jgi:hypothetical protein
MLFTFLVFFLLENPVEKTMNCSSECNNSTTNNLNATTPQWMNAQYNGSIMANNTLPINPYKIL